jgi:hypothetical protein
MRGIAGWTCALLFGGLACAQEVPIEGSTVIGALTIGRSTFALPPGEWKVVSTGTGNVGYTNQVGSKGADTATVYVAQLDADRRFVASIQHRVPLASSRTESWTSTLCDRKDTLFRDAFSENLRFPECLLINHIVRFWVTEPAAGYDKKIWEWYRANNVALPVTVLNCEYRNYFAGDYVIVAAWVNPEGFGQAPSTKTAWAESEWHPRAIRNDPVRAAFVDNFKKWCYVMAESAKATLMDRKPKASALPPLTELTVK